MGGEEDTPIRHVFEQIGERFGGFDLEVRTSFPLPSYLILTLTPAPADPNMRLLPPRGTSAPSTHHPRTE